MTKLVPAAPAALVVTRKDVDGIDMGVLDDGTAFLASRGLARLCGVAPSVIIELNKSWTPQAAGRRDQAIAKILQQTAYKGDRLCIEASERGQRTNAHPDTVCMAVLEYYAFEAGINKTEQALSVFRKLARHTLRELIYRSVGYDPQSIVPAPWRQFHDRLLLNKVPAGWFSVFREIAEFVLASIRFGLVVDEHTVPDISVGKAWSEHWTSEDMSERYGERQKWPHTYPDYFPQSTVSVEAFIYPVEALGEFRRWLEDEYLPTKYPRYLERKVKQGLLPPSTAELLIESVAPAEPPQLKGG